MPEVSVFDIAALVACFISVGVIISIGVWSIVRSLNILREDSKAIIKLLSEYKNVKSVGQSSGDVEQIAAAPRTIGKPQVGELAPETIAPNLRKPPRPAGGFGRRVGEPNSGKPRNNEEDDTTD